MKYLLEGGGLFLRSTTFSLGVVGGWEGVGLVDRDGRENEPTTYKSKQGGWHCFSSLRSMNAPWA